MSDETKTEDSLGPQPEPQTQEPELYPGGTDAVVGQDRYQHDPDDPAARDLDPEDNPAVEDELPEEISDPDDEKTQEPAEGEDEIDEDQNPSEPPG